MKKKSRSENQEEETNLRYDPSQRQTLPPANSVPLEIPQFQYPKLNDVIISPREGQKFTISKLVEDARPGTTINIPTGAYTDSIYVDKPIKFIANGPVKIISSNIDPVITIAAEGVSFRGFEFTHRKSDDNSSAAIVIESGSALFLDCNIKSDACPSLLLHNDSIINANSCRFISKSAPNFLAMGSCSGTFELCNFQGSNSNGVVLRDDCKIRFTRCTMQGFTKNGCVICGNAKSVLEKCRITACALNGIELCSNEQCTVLDTSIEGCGGCGISAFQLASLRLSGSTIEGCYSSGLEVREGAAARINGNVFSHCGAPGTLYVYEQATVDSIDDKFTSTGPIAIGVLGNSSVMMRQAVIEDISGRGALVTDDATLSITDSRFERTDQTSVTCTNGGAIVLSQSYVLNSGELGLLISECHSAQIVKTHIDSCALSGAEINNVPTGLTIDECNFTRCRQCGIVVISSTFEISVSNALQNCFSGFEARSSSIGLHRCRSEDNSAGGICAREASKLVVDTCIIQNNGQVGLSLESKSTMKVSNSTVSTNTRLGIAVESESFLTLKSSIVSDHACVALQVEGKDSRAFVDKCNFTKNDTAILGVLYGRIGAKNVTFEENNLQLELRDNSKIKANSCKFTLSRDRAALNILANCQATFDDCEISKNAGVGIACEGEIIMTTCQIFKNRMGVFCYGQCTGNISQSHIYENAKCGIYVQEGTLKINLNLIETHEAYGISISDKAQPVVESNEFKQNGIMDINRE